MTWRTFEDRTTWWVFERLFKFSQVIKTVHLILDLLVVSWFEIEFCWNNHFTCFLEHRTTVTKTHITSINCTNISVFCKNLSRDQDMSNFTTIGTSIHKDGTTNTTWNPRCKFKACQALETSHLGCRNQIRSRFSFNLITIHCDTIKPVKHNHKTSDTTVTDNQITGITKHHPRNVMFISKFDNTS